MRGPRPAAVLLLLGALVLTACEPPDAPGGTTGAVGAQAAAAAQAPAQAQEEPAFSVAVEPEATDVVLGEKIVLKVTVTNDGDGKLRVNVPRLDRKCATVRVRLPGEEPYVLERLVAKLVPPGRLDWIMPDAQELAPGASLSGTLTLTAAQVGKHHMTVSYRRSVSGKALTADAVEVTVKPDGEKQHLGVRVETSEGGLTVRLRPDLAPNTVESFAALVRKGFFDGLTFHRIVKGFMAQGGDPEGTGGGGPGYYLPLEAQRELLHARGVLSMARTDLPDTAGSQFFLLFTKYPSLDPSPGRPGYTTFGETVDGKETLDKLEAVETEIPAAIRKEIKARGIPQEQVDMLVRAGRIEKSSPVEKVTIKSMKLLTLD